MAALVAIYVVTIWQPWVTRVEAANVANMAFPLPDKPSLVVLPFENLSGDPAQDFLVDGLSEDITTALARLPSIFVMSRNSAMTYKGRAVKVQEVAEDLGVQYVLEGSVQRDGDRLRVNAQLIDALSGRHVWADRFDRDVTDLFAVKDEITLRIATNISSELGAELRDRPQYRGTNNLEAWLLYRQARALWDEFTPEANLRMRDLFLRAMELDPDYSGPIAQMATAYWQAASFGFTDDPVGALEIAAEFAERALSVNPSEPQGYVALATLHLAAQNVDAALEAATKAAELMPDWGNQGVLGWILNMDGRPAEGRDYMKLSLRLNPNPDKWVFAVLGNSYLLLESYEKAEAMYGRTGTNAPPFWEFRSRAFLALVYDATSREDEAREIIARAVEAYPQASINGIVGGSAYDRSILDRWAATWRRLGLPE